MNDLCLRFADEAEALRVLVAAGFDVESAAPGEYTLPGARLSVIGPITRPIGEPDADGMQPTETLDGWHVNALLAGEVPEALQPYIVSPAARVRVWA